MKVLTAWVATVLVRFNAMMSVLKGVSTYIVPCLFLQRKTKIGPNLHKMFHSNWFLGLLHSKLPCFVGAGGQNQMFAGKAF